jgi:hypothetical protein
MHNVGPVPRNYIALGNRYLDYIHERFLSDPSDNVRDRFATLRLAYTVSF